jgi:hypothetical protein
MSSFRERVFGSSTSTSTDSNTTNNTNSTKQLAEDDGYLVMFVLDEKVSI